jgi:hypothetical protein
VWLDPQVSDTLPVGNKLLDCLGRVEMVTPAPLPRATHCIATVVSPGFESLLDDLLGSLYANGGCQDALLVVLIVDGNSACEQVRFRLRLLVLIHALMRQRRRPCIHLPWSTPNGFFALMPIASAGDLDQSSMRSMPVLKGVFSRRKATVAAGTSSTRLGRPRTVTVAAMLTPNYCWAIQMGKRILSGCE